MKKLFLILNLFLTLPSIVICTWGQDHNVKFSRPYLLSRVLTMTIDSSINPSTLNYLQKALAAAKEKNYEALVIKMNTPGGLVMTTKSILTTIGESPIPIIVWVTPEGASATSAGAIISSGSHFLFMSPGTNIGAATPIEMTGDMGKDLRKKAINDLVALVKGLSHERGRNEEMFAEMISGARSFSATEAMEKGIINGIVSSYGDMWKILADKDFHLKGENRILQISSPTQIDEFPMSIGEYIFNIFANPSLTYILFLMGAALIYFELQAPGGFIAGSIGVGLLILAGIGFDVLPLNFGALGLIILSFVFFILEMFITSYGLLTIGGIISLTIGSFFLFSGDNGTIQLGHTMIFSSVLAVATFVLFVLYFLTKNIKHKTTSFFSLVGKKAVVTEISDHQEYYVKIHGEIWRARGLEGISFHLNEEVKILAKNPKELVLTIGKL